MTESAIFDKVARAFDIHQWPVTAIKSYVGHSLAPASGDQLVATLGSFAHGLLPGIKTIDHVADDVLAERLSISAKDVAMTMDVAFVNSKGFGGNNATAVVLSPDVTARMLNNRYGNATMCSYAKRNESVIAAAQAYHRKALQGDLQPLYQFGEAVIDDADIHIARDGIALPGFKGRVDLQMTNRYEDMC